MPKKRKKAPAGECLRLDPEKRLCPQFDATGVKLFEAPTEEMGFRVVDDAAQEHIM